MALDRKRRRFTVEEYYRMAEAGILGEDDRVELIDGEVIQMTPIGPGHASCVARLVNQLVRSLGPAAVIWPQNPVRLSEHSEPQPDVALLRPRADVYASGHPTPADVLLVIEVGATSAEPDRRVKVLLYAESGTPEVWLVDLEQNTITVHLDPAGGSYRLSRVVRPGEHLAPSAFPDRPLAVADPLPT